MIIALDTSAVAKLVIQEPESTVLEHYVREVPADAPMVVSTLAGTELRRLVIRLGLPVGTGTEILAGFDVLPLTGPMLHQAGTFPQRQLGTLDALHLATAVAVGADILLTYDARLAEAAAQEGLRVESPGR